MMYINTMPNASGAYSAPQSNPVPGLLVFPDDLMPEFLQYNGFVTLDIVNESVVDITPNTEAWSAWIASRPETAEEAPSEIEQLRADLEFIAIMTGVEL